jgi:ketosteroid isomerase-like protein
MSNLPSWTCPLIATSGLAALMACDGRTIPSDLTAADSAAIAQVQSAYVRAWLADDTAGVLATLDRNAILLPPGHQPVQGHAAIRAYWWPDDGSHTKITRFTWDVAEVLGSGTLAVARGLSTVSWTYTKDTVHSEQTVRNLSLSVLARGPAGEWLIERQMWGPALK